jgi:hypothetical protein
MRAQTNRGLTQAQMLIAINDDNTAGNSCPSLRRRFSDGRRNGGRSGLLRVTTGASPFRLPEATEPPSHCPGCPVCPDWPSSPNRIPPVKPGGTSLAPCRRAPWLGIGSAESHPPQPIAARIITEPRAVLTVIPPGTTRPHRSALAGRPTRSELKGPQLPARRGRSGCLVNSSWGFESPRQLPRQPSGWL